MNHPRLAALFAHLALAIAGISLTCAEFDFLVETIGVLVVYLVLLAVSWHSAGRWTLPTWAANAIGVAITLLSAVWIVVRFRNSELMNWLQDVPISVALVPYLGPFLMALTVVRLYRPRAPGDFWVLQGLGLVQVALGCVLTNGTVFGVLVLTYLVVAICALAAHESVRQAALSAPTGPPRPPGLANWAGFSLRWTLGIGALALPVFLLTPRAEGPEDWDPLTRFLSRNRPRISHTGFSDEVDLTRTGRLETDDGVAFNVGVTDGTGGPWRDLRADQRWRGLVLDRYDDGLWRSDLSYSNSRAISQPPREEPNSPDQAVFEFKVPGSAGGLFLAEPVVPGPVAGTLAVWPKGNYEGFRRTQALFFEADGTFVPFNHLIRKEYRYTQAMTPLPDVERYPALRVRGSYQERLLRLRVPGMKAFTRDLLLRLTKRRGEYWGELHGAVATGTQPVEVLPPMYWEDVARTLNNYLARSGDFAYSLVSRRQATNLDPTLDFLVNVREGRCEHYASALALMLRSVGVPARIVKGYRGFDSGTDTYQVRQSHAHAWVEVLVASTTDPKGFDWLILDPTPDNDSSGLVLSPLGRLWQLQQTGQALWQNLIVGYSSREQADLLESLSSWERWKGRLPWIAAAVAVPGLLLLLRWQRRRWRKRQVGARSLYDRLAVALARGLHLTARSDETPRELATRAVEALGRRTGVAAPLVEVPARIVDLFYRVRFGGEVLTASQLAEASAQLEALEGALQR